MTPETMTPGEVYLVGDTRTHTAVDPRHRQIPAALEQLANLTEAMTAHLGELEARLAPVLAPAPEEDPTANDPPTGVEIADIIRSANVRVDVMVGRLRGLLLRLEV